MTETANDPTLFNLTVSEAAVYVSLAWVTSGKETFASKLNTDVAGDFSTRMIRQPPTPVPAQLL